MFVNIFLATLSQTRRYFKLKRGRKFIRVKSFALVATRRLPIASFTSSKYTICQTASTKLLCAYCSRVNRISKAH